MPLFNIRHAECEDVGEGWYVEAKTAKLAVETANPCFRYYAGDADSWDGVKPHLKHLKAVSGRRPSDIKAGTEPYMASVDDTPDYFLVYQVASVPGGKTILVPSTKE